MTRNFVLSALVVSSVTSMAVAADESPQPAPPALPTKATFLITGLHCPPCTKTLEASLRRQPGIRSVQVDWNTKNARIEFDEGTVPAQRVSQLVASTPHMMGARMQYAGWLALKVPELKDDASAALVKTALGKVAGVRRVTAYPEQHAIGVQFAPEGRVRSDQLLTALREAGIDATNY